MEHKSALRRKLLRGSLAAPVVLTVSSASAATASFARCLNNTNAGVSTTAFFVGSTDTWFRAQVPVTGLWANGSDLGYFYEDPVKNAFVSINAPYAVMPYNSATMPNYVKVTSQSSRWALVWFDKATTTRYSKISIQRPFGSTATTMSCYGSFNKA